MNTNIFKAYDIRGKYPEEINTKVVQTVSRALAEFFSAKGALPAGRQGSASGGKKGKVVLGHDVRFGSRELYRAAAQGLKRSNPKLKIVEAGLMTTPALYFLVNYFGASGGLMITASHSPKEINGLKVVGSGAAPIGGKDILRLLR